jgi:hypothetical protein
MFSQGIMAVFGLPFVTERIILLNDSFVFVDFDVKFFGGGERALAANVFPSPKFPWQTSQRLR